MPDPLTGTPTRNGHPPLVIKLGGAAVDAPDDLDGVYGALAALHRGREGGVVLVHGGGAAVDRHLARIGVVSTRHGGIRITPAGEIDDVVAVLAGTVNKRLVGRLQRHGAHAVGLCLGDGGIARTITTAKYGFDAGRVGEIGGGDPRLVRLLLAGGYLPVLCSIGLDDDGAALNVNADDAAAGVAQLLDASALVFLTDVPGVLDGEGRLLGELDPDGVEQRIADGQICDGMIAKVRSAARAAGLASLAVTIASWKEPENVGALLDGSSVGTRILPGPPPRAILGHRESLP